MEATASSSNIFSMTETEWFLEGCLERNQTIRRIPITVDRFQIGRRPEMHLFLTCPTVSKLHAEILPFGDGLVLRDLKSTNGTFLNGERVYDTVSLGPGDLVQFAGNEFRVGCRGVALAGQTKLAAAVETAWLLTQFDRLLSERAVVPYFQPVMVLGTRRTYGYEALARSNVPGFRTPLELFRAATQLDVAEQLSEVCREKAVDAAVKLPGSPTIFLNTHPREELHRSLGSSLERLRQTVPQMPLVLELHEAAIQSTHDVRELRSLLKDLRIGLAYDDFGAGQARLKDLVRVPPDFIKFDMGLIRNIDQIPEQQRLVGTLVRLVNDLGIAALAEGIETAGEADACIELGFQYAQGFHFGRPSPVNVSLSCEAPDTREHSTLAG